MRSRARRIFLLAALSLAACKVNEPGLTVLVTADDEVLVRDGRATGNDGGHVAQAEAELALAKVVVARRRALWDPDPKTSLRNTPNPTIYQDGYLREGDTLCFWERARAQLRNAVQQAGQFVPGCVL